MAGKRGATSDLNHLNWNNEETPEEAGTFKRAADDIIKNRVIKTAKRRNPISSVSSDGDKKGVFGTFTGFNKAPPPATNAFNFLSNLTKTEQPKTNGISEKTVSTSASSTSPSFPIEPSSQKRDTMKQKEGKSDNYYARLKGLNESVSKWIKVHVDENPFVNLQPIFKDYEKYYEEIEKEDQKSKDNLNKITTNTLFKSNTPAEPKENVSSSSGFASFTFKPAGDIPSANQPTGKEKSTFGSRFGVTSTTESKEPQKFSFGLKDTNQSEKPSTSESPKFTFGTSSNKNVESPKGKLETVVPSFSFGSGKTLSQKQSESDSSKSTFNSGNATAESSKFTFGSNATSTEKKSETDPPVFKFGSENAALSQNKSETGTPKFSFGSGNTTSTENKAEAPKFSFGSGNAAATGFQFDTTTAPSFSFSSSATSTATTGFNFPKPSSTPGFTFANVAKPESTEEKKAEDEEDEPPKVEFTPVVEEGHVYTTKCKVFVKKDKVFGDRGIGNLYLKPVPDSEKTQLIVRADTNLGNLLCNFILSESIPMQRMGKKDVMLVCLPTPDFKPPPVPVLLRVKSPEDADKLLETLEKYKK